PLRPSRSTLLPYTTLFRSQGSKPASRRSARASLRVLDCVLAPATVLSSGSWRSPRLRCAQFLFYEFSLVPEGHAASKKSSVAHPTRKSLARWTRLTQGPNTFEARCIFKQDLMTRQSGASKELLLLPEKICRCGSSRTSVVPIQRRAGKLRRLK